MNFDAESLCWLCVKFVNIEIYVSSCQSAKCIVGKFLLRDPN